MPRHEAVQPAERADQLVAGTQEEMIRVGEDDPGVDLAGEVALQHALYRGLGAHGHERGRLDSRAACGATPRAPG